MSKIRKSFILHHDSLNVLDDLTDDQAGLLFKAIKAYHLGDEFKLDTLTNIAMSPFRNQFDRDAVKYENLCEKNRLIAENRYSTKSTSGKSGNQALPEVTKSTDNDSKSDSDSKNKSDNDKEVIKDIVVSTPAFNFKNELLSLGVDKDILNDWMKVRKNKNATNTESAFRLLVSQISKSGLTIDQGIRFANSENWGAFKLTWYQNKQGANNGHQGTGRKESSHERIKRENDVKYRGQNECGLAMGENDGHLGRAVGEGERELTISRLDNTDFIDY